ncbi:MAG TPA: TIGR04255 family protein [Candidatus Saccharimonadales bacterium]|nr:TIGR04255 family protein [Candidatus Saccharimonadales bacterium]
MNDDQTHVNPAYGENFLTQVVLKIDFSSIEAINVNSVNTAFESLEGGFNPAQILEKIDLRIEDHEGELTTNRIVDSIFKIEKDDSNFIEITKTSIVIATTSYSSFTTFSQFFTPILEMFFEKFTVTQASRIGLRYINDIDLEESSDLFNWNNIISPSLVSNLNFVDDKSHIRRAMHNIFLEHDEDTLINFNYGMFNKTFPSKILSKEFVLDYECFTPYGTEVNDIIPTLTNYNQIITDVFEKSIGDELRERMRQQ